LKVAGSHAGIQFHGLIILYTKQYLTMSACVSFYDCINQSGHVNCQLSTVNCPQLDDNIKNFY